LLREAVVGQRVGHEQVLMRPGRDAHRPGVSDVVIDGLHVQVVVEHLDPHVAAIADVDVAGRVHRHRVRQVQLARWLPRVPASLMKRPLRSNLTTRELP
jgi:hypothetical protein